MTYRPARSVGGIAIALVLTLLSACASLPVSQTYLGTEQFGSTALAPGEWEVFDAAAVRRNAEGVGPLFLQGFGAEGVDPTAPMSGSQPGGILSINLHRGIDAARTAAANSFIVDLNAATASGAARILGQRGPTVDGTWEQWRWIVEVSLTQGTVTRVVQTVQLSVNPVGADRDGTELHAVKALVVGCAPGCFEANTATFSEIEDSWRVR